MTHLIANNIKKCREGANLSQQALADHIHVSRQTISNWERGVSQPDLDSLMLLAEEFHVDVEEVIYGEKPLDNYQTNKTMRIKCAFFWGIVFLVTAISSAVLIPQLYAYRIYNITPYAIVSTMLQPLVVILGTMFFFSTLSIWLDFRISNKRLCSSMIILAFSFTLLYISFMLLSAIGPYFGFYLCDIIHSASVYDWLAVHPVIFIFPGAMLFCGFNKNPEPSQPDPQPIQEVDAV